MSLYVAVTTLSKIYFPFHITSVSAAPHRRKYYCVLSQFFYCFDCVKNFHLDSMKTLQIFCVLCYHDCCLIP